MVTKNRDARVLNQCARRMHVRNVAAANAILAVDRATIDTDSHTLATVIDGEVSTIVPIFTAPCDAIIVRCYVNAQTYPTTTGAATVVFSKANIGASDTALNTAIDIDAATAQTAIDGVLSTTSSDLDVIDGQLVYATVALSATTSVRSDGLVLCVEWVPKI